MYGDDLDKIMSQKRFVADKGFSGAEGSSRGAGPVQVIYSSTSLGSQRALRCFWHPVDASETRAEFGEFSGAGSPNDELIRSYESAGRFVDLCVCSLSEMDLASRRVDNVCCASNVLVFEPKIILSGM